MFMFVNNNFIYRSILGLKLPPRFWETLKKVSEVLKPLAILTTQLQDQSLTIPHFHQIWLLAVNQVKKAVHKHNNWRDGKYLLVLIEARRAKIYENPIILAGVYLDPRFRVMLTVDERKSAKDAIKIILQKYESLNDSPSIDNSSPMENDDDNSFDELDSLIAEASVDKSQCSSLESEPVSSPAASSSSKIDLELGIFDALAPVSNKTNAITSWKINKVQFPILSSIAIDIICIPVTEVTSERLFSGLNIVFNKQRARLDPGVTDDVLLLRWNKDFLSSLA